MFLYNYRRNFGDELAPYIVSKIVPDEFVYWRKPFRLSNLLVDFLRFCKRALTGRGETGDLLAYEFNHKVLVAIGSIIEEATANTVVWGAGISHRNTKISSYADIRAVRGPKTLQRMKELGLKTEGVSMGDPAILLPKYYFPNVDKKFKIGLIPHKSEFKIMREKIAKLDVLDRISLIDLCDPNIESVVQNILKCESIFSTSLHGIIVSHSYGIPALWIKNADLIGDDVKFEDYFASVGIPQYKPIEFADLLARLKTENISGLQNTITSLPQREAINRIQHSLLSSFPLDLRIHTR